MEGFCRRQMRKEYRGVLNLLVYLIVLLLLLTAVYGAFVIAFPDQRAERMLLIAAVSGVAVLFCAGLYLVFTDTKRLLRKTPFGLALTRLGDPEALMVQIDESAKKRLERLGPLALLSDWLILHYPSPTRLDPLRSCAVPIRRESVARLRLYPEHDPDDPQKRHIALETRDGAVYDFYVFQQSALDALRDWLEEQERP